MLSHSFGVTDYNRELILVHPVTGFQVDSVHSIRPWYLFMITLQIYCTLLIAMGLGFPTAKHSIIPTDKCKRMNYIALSPTGGNLVNALMPTGGVTHPPAPPGQKGVAAAPCAKPASRGIPPHGGRPPCPPYFSARPWSESVI